MLGVFQKAGTGALGSLMALAGRYLAAYTIHTKYNVRDWGINYLDSKMPTDLAGRAEQDCGVYALTVAWDVYKALKASAPKMDVTFELYAMLEHVTLVITDKGSGEFYVVNNNNVSAAKTGDPLAEVAPHYGAVRGLPYTVGPAMEVDLGSTKDPQRRFHDQVWQRYLASADWGLGLEIPPDVQKQKTKDPEAYASAVLAIQKERYTKFYGGQESLSRGLQRLDPEIDKLLPLLGQKATFEAALGPTVDRAGVLGANFMILSSGADPDVIGKPKTSPDIAVGSKKSQAILPKQSSFLFTTETGHTTHPLARAGMAILHAQANGSALTPKAAAFLQFCDTVPQFKAKIDAYQKAGATGQF
jgi:hypothetical protein